MQLIEDIALQLFPLFSEGEIKTDGTLVPIAGSFLGEVVPGVQHACSSYNTLIQYNFNKMTGKEGVS
jgi:hypothetical protein